MMWVTFCYIGSLDREDEFDVNLSDSRFKALLSNDGRFGIDPTSSDFQSTRAMQKVLKEQRKRLRKEASTEEARL